MASTMYRKAIIILLLDLKNLKIVIVLRFKKTNVFLRRGSIVIPVD